MVDIGQNITALAGGPAVVPVRKEAAAEAKPARAESFAKVEAKAKEGEAPQDFGLSGSDEPLEKVAEVVQSFLPDSFNNNTKLSINRDDTTGVFVYRSVDRESGEVVRQFPPEDILNYIVSVRKAEGLIVDGEA
ncbi:MAG: flagellar protein FlaG [Sphingomonadales bacterium]|nr:flagellar protein FlaG [Sphingomonadales bacterium]